MTHADWLFCLHRRILRGASATTRFLMIALPGATSRMRRHSRMTQERVNHTSHARYGRFKGYKYPRQLETLGKKNYMCVMKGLPPCYSCTALSRDTIAQDSRLFSVTSIASTTRDAPPQNKTTFEPGAFGSALPLD